MSQGGTPIDASVSQPRRSPDDTPTLHSLIRQGKSFSANEPNSFFLNTGAERFSNLSTISGLNFQDDGRAIALVDWDQDGDLDLWFANRNGPQVRFLRNDVPNNNHYLALRLVGKTCNRDAIGARVEIILRDRSPGRRIKTLRAGEGFLSQSSKWIHFGLGGKTRVDRVIVTWPAGDPEEFRGFAVDHSYILEQGSGAAVPFVGPTRHLAISPSDLPPPRVDLSSAVFLSSPVPIPPLTYKAAGISSARIGHPDGKPKLVVFWASWCERCKGELVRLAKRHQEIRETGVEVLALSVDALGGDGKSATSEIDFLSQIGFPFEIGEATTSLVEKLKIVRDQLFDRITPPLLPNSILLNANGKLVAIYDGSLEVDRLMQDLAKLELTPRQTRDASVQFPGRWLASPARISLVPIYQQLMRRGFSKDAKIFRQENADRFQK